MLLSDDHSKVQVLHRLKRHIIPHGVPTTLFHGRTFATCNDVTDLGPVTTMVPDDMFHRTEALTGVRTAAGIDAALAATRGGQQQLEAATDSDPDTGTVCTRVGMLVPPAYAAAVLTAATSPEGLTPRRLWSEVVLVLRATAGHEASCVSFLDWCRVAVSHGVGGQNPLNHAAPTLVWPDARLSSERLQILRGDLPHRFLAVSAGKKKGYVRAAVSELDPAIARRKNYNIKACIETHGPTPVNDAGGPMCLSFHLRGSCRHECDRGPNSKAANDHKRHNTGETTRLKAYLDLAGLAAIPSGNY